MVQIHSPRPFLVAIYITRKSGDGLAHAHLRPRVSLTPEPIRAPHHIWGAASLLPSAGARELRSCLSLASVPKMNREVSDLSQPADEEQESQTS